MAGKFLIFLLILPHFCHGIPGDDQRKRRAAQSNQRHGRVVLHHHQECPAEGHQGGDHVGDKTQDVAGHGACIAVDAVKQVTAGISGKGLKIRFHYLSENINADFVHDFHVDAHGKPAPESPYENLGNPYANIQCRNPRNVSGFLAGDGVHQVLGHHRGSQPQHRSHGGKARINGD